MFYLNKPKPRPIKGMFGYEFAQNIAGELEQIIKNNQNLIKARIKKQGDNYQEYLKQVQIMNQDKTFIADYSGVQSMGINSETVQSMGFFYLLSAFIFEPNLKKELIISHKSILTTYGEKIGLPHLLNEFFILLDSPNRYETLKSNLADNESLRVLDFCKRHFEYYIQTTPTKEQVIRAELMGMISTSEHLELIVSVLIDELKANLDQMQRQEKAEEQRQKRAEQNKAIREQIRNERAINERTS